MAGRVVAELGRPETADETAARKAESSRIYRSSQTARNLVAALIATVAIVVIIVFGVPRGELAAPPAIDVAKRAAAASESTGRIILHPDTPADWRVNVARLDGNPLTWTVTYAPNASSDDAGFLTLNQALSSDATWAERKLVGARPGDEVTIDGISWTEFTIRDSSASANVSYALGTQAGSDYVLLAGSATPELTQTFAASLTLQLNDLKNEGSQ